MIYKVMYRLVQIKERYEAQVWSNMEGLVNTSISKDCCKFLPDQFDTIAEADEIRKLKAYPDDYIVVNVW